MEAPLTVGDVDAVGDVEADDGVAEGLEGVDDVGADATGGAGDDDDPFADRGGGSLHVSASVVATVVMAVSMASTASVTVESPMKTERSAIQPASSISGKRASAG